MRSFLVKFALANIPVEIKSLVADHVEQSAPAARAQYNLSHLATAPAGFAIEGLAAMAKAIAKLLFAVLVITSVFPSPAAALPGFCRGIGIRNMMDAPEVVSSTDMTFKWPPYQSPWYVVENRELRMIKSSGFDFIRLAVNPGPFLQFSGKRRDKLFEILQSNVHRVLESGLNVIVDFHPTERNPEYAPKALLVGPSEPIFLRFKDVVAHTASMLAGLPKGRIALELLNEPNIGYYSGEEERWRGLLATLYESARKSAPSLLIIVSGSEGGSIAGLQKLDPEPFRGANVAYTFHYYSPMQFTHQNDGGSAEHRDIVGLPFPPSSDRLIPTYSQIFQRIAQDGGVSADEKPFMLVRAQTMITQYFLSGAGPATVHSDFAKAREWAIASHIPAERILLGEFGVRRTYSKFVGATDADRSRWLFEVRHAAEENAFGWSVWDYRDSGGWALAEDDGSGKLDKPTLRSLGLDRKKLAGKCGS